MNMLRADPISWLLEPDNPSIRSRTLTELLDARAADPQVHEAQAAMSAHPPVAALLEEQKKYGYWVKRDYYLPKYCGTFWTLSVLADLGLTADNEHVRRGCEFMFTFQREHGGICRRRRVQGRGIVWDEQPGPCTHARIVRFLMQFGYGDDPRTQAAVDWLIATQRDDGMWHCGTSRHGCLRATHDVLRVAALDPRLAAQPGIARAADVLCDLLMQPRMGRYHVSDAWTRLVYPHFNYGVISSLDALAHLGYRMTHPKVQEAVDYLLSRQRSDGTWPLDGSPRKPPLDFGPVGQPNKWLTLGAVRVLKLLQEV
jgi:hypothetical protein